MIKALIWIVSGAVITLFICNFLVYHDISFWKYYYRKTFLFLTTLAFLAAGTASLRIKRFSFREQLSIAIFVITMVMALLLSFITIGRTYYSRKYLIIFYFFTIFGLDWVFTFTAIPRLFSTLSVQ